MVVPPPQSPPPSTQRACSRSQCEREALVFQRRANGPQIQDQEDQETRAPAVKDMKNAHERVDILYSITPSQYRML